MHANRNGTLTEQQRARVGWLSATAAALAGIPLTNRCGECQHQGWSEIARGARPRCEHHQFATSAQATCRDWRWRPTHTVQDLHQQLRIARRVAVNPRATPDEVAAARGSVEMLTRLLIEENTNA